MQSASRLELRELSQAGHKRRLAPRLALSVALFGVSRKVDVSEL